MNPKKQNKMATLQDYEKLTERERRSRYFSEEFKRKKVNEIDRNLVSASAVSREHQVSLTSIYRWIYKYSKMRKKGLKQVVELKSEAKKVSELQKEIRELQRIVGEKQILLDFKDKMISIAEGEYGVEIKKKFSGPPYSGTGETGKSTN